MLRFLEVTEGKQIQIVKAGAALKRGAPVAKSVANDNVTAATGDPLFLVDNAPNYDGVNAAIIPDDAAFEDIASGTLCLAVPAYVGERYATTELTVGSLSKGDTLTASAGKFVAGENGKWAYGGTYSDPTGLTMYIVERIA